jgi:TnpA family transposase
MAEASGISYGTLAWTTEWYLREDTLRAANAAVVNHHHTLPLSSVGAAGRCPPRTVSGFRCAARA